MKRARLLLGCTLLLALGVRLAVIDHGLPHRYVADTHMVRGALGMAQTRDLAPPPIVFTSYPYLMPYLLLPQYGALYVAGKIAREWSGPDEFAARITDDPTPVYLIARVLVASFGVLGVLLVYRLAKRFLREGAAVFAAYLAATSLLLVHLSQSARPWVPLVTLILFAADRSAAYALRPTTKRAMLAGFGAGLAIACMQAGALAVLLPGAAISSRLKKDGFGRVIGRGAAAAAVFGVTALFLGYPYLLRGESADVHVSVVDPGAATQDVVVDPDAQHLNLGGQGLAFELFGFERFQETALGFVLAEPALLLLALFGLRPAWKRLAKKRLRLTLLAYPTVVLVLFLFYAGTHTRYLVPVVPFAALLAGAGAARWWRKPWRRPFVVLLASFPLAAVVELDVITAREDSRTAFLAVIAREVPAGERIAVDVWGPPLRMSADGAAWLQAQDKPLNQQQRREAAGLAPLDPDRPPYAVIPLEAFYRFKSAWPHQWWKCPPDAEPGHPAEKPIDDFLRELDVRWVVTTDKFPSDPRNAALDDVLARRGRLVAELRPDREVHGRGNGRAFELKLPMDPRHGVLALWGVERPGPALALWELVD